MGALSAVEYPATREQKEYDAPARDEADESYKGATTVGALSGDARFGE